MRKIFSPLAQNRDGLIYWPKHGVNDIGVLDSGETYRVYVDPKASPEAIGLALPYTRRVETGRFDRHFPLQTGQLEGSAVLLVETDLKNGDEVAVKTKEGVVVGSGLVHDGKVAISIWPGFDPNNSGVRSEESLTLVGWSTEDHAEVAFELQFRILLNCLETIPTHLRLKP